MYVEGVKNGRKFFETLKMACAAQAGRRLEGRPDRSRRARHHVAHRLARGAAGRLGRR